MSICVQDTGIGIDRKNLKQVFSRFGKSQRTAEINSDGLGLGLTIVRQIAESWNGDVSAHSDGIN